MVFSSGVGISGVARFDTLFPGVSGVFKEFRWSVRGSFLYCAKPDDDENNTDRIPITGATIIVCCVGEYAIKACCVGGGGTVGHFNCKSE